LAIRNHKTISFKYNGVAFRIKDSLLVKSQLAVVLAKENLQYSGITYVFSSDEYVLELNRKYLQHDYYTDILTFTLSLPNEPILSEIYISIDRVRENAENFGISFETELQRVMIHGLLHLAGYNDHTEEEKKIMRGKENFYMAEVG